VQTVSNSIGAPDRGEGGIIVASLPALKAPG
jgi:hypothetical protein